MSQSTIKMDKGYYQAVEPQAPTSVTVAIHNKNGQGLLLDDGASGWKLGKKASQSTIKMDKGYYSISQS